MGVEELFLKAVLYAGGITTLWALWNKFVPKIMGWLYKKIIKPHADLNSRCDELDKRLKNSEAGNLALLHDRVYKLCQEHLDEGEISLDDLENLDYLYRAYCDLNGNGMCAKLHGRVSELKIKEK
ncbi:hypothetical protein Q5O14_18025 [Eubacteriaceae bacterium ES2]|nr:hypothetical protein Q5O14_18025 [Eubacteriaceae bacterium ES2]